MISTENTPTDLPMYTYITATQQKCVPYVAKLYGLQNVVIGFNLLQLPNRWKERFGC
jgi:hypothetical protein